MNRAASGLTVTLSKVGKLLSNADQPTLVVIILVIVLLFIIVWKLFSNRSYRVCYLLFFRNTPFLYVFAVFEATGRTGVGTSMSSALFPLRQ